VKRDDNGCEATLGRRSLPPERGNMLADTYNTAGKLVGFTKGTSSIINTYSGLGERMRQISEEIFLVRRYHSRNIKYLRKCLHNYSYCTPDQI
jgi:hypothetical protein